MERQKTTQDVTFNLPSSTLRIPACSSRPGLTPLPPACSPFPTLKIKVTPRVSAASNLAPPMAKGKGLEAYIKVVVPVGSKVSVSWQVDTQALPLPSLSVIEASETRPLAADVVAAVGEWLVINQDVLAIDHFAYPSTPLPATHSLASAELIFTPSMALPSHQPVRNALVPASEPVAHLESLHLAISWVAPSTRVSAATVAPSSRPTRDPTQEVVPSQPHEEDVHARESLLHAEVLSQVGAGMKKVLRMQMVRRFPYIFDGDFLQYQSSLAFPAAILDATSRFLTLSARHNTPLLPKCKALFDIIDETQSNTMMRRIDATARLSTKCSHKRSKIDSQPTQTQMEEDEEDERAAKIVAARERQRLLDANMSAEAKLRKSLARGVAEIGAAKWLRGRAGMGKLAAWRQPLVEAEYYEDDEDARLVDQEDQASPSGWEMLGPMDDEYDPFPSLPPNSPPPPPPPPAPQDLRLDLFGSDDEYDHFDDEEPGPVAKVAPGHADYEPPSAFSSHTPDKPLNALLLDLGLGHLCKPTGFGAFNHATLEVPNSQTPSEHISSPPRSARRHDLFGAGDVAEESDNDLDDIREQPHDDMDDDEDDLATLYSNDDTDNDLEAFYSDIDSPRSDHDPQNDLDCAEGAVTCTTSPSHASQVSDVFEYCNMESLSLSFGLEDGNDLDDEAGEVVDAVRASRLVLDGDTNYEDSYTDDLDLDDGECDALDMGHVHQQRQQQPDPETVNDLDDDDPVRYSVSHRLVGDLWQLPHFSPSPVVAR